MAAGRNKRGNIPFRLIEESAIPYGRVGCRKKEKGAGPDTKSYPNDINGDIDGAETPVLPVEQPDKKRTMGKGASYRHKEGVRKEEDTVFAVAIS